MDDDAWSALVSLYDSGKVDEAESRCREALRLEPDQLEAIYLLGRIHLDRADSAQAIALLRRAAQLAPDWPEAHAGLGAALLHGSRLEEATYHLRRAADLERNDPEAQNNLGVALQTGGRAKEAEAAFLEALRLRPDYPEALRNLGSTLSSLGQYSEAAARFRQALARGLQDPEILLDLGDAYLALEEYDAAEREFRRALERSPGSALALSRVEATRAARSSAISADKCVLAGAEYLKGGQAAAAAAAFRQALLVSPDHVDALRGLAVTLLRTGRPDQARAILERLLDLSDPNAELLNTYGVALDALGEKRQAAAQFRKALEIDPSCRGAMANLIRALLDIDEVGEALPLCRRGLELWPDSAELHLALGATLSRQRGSEAAAARAFRDAVRLDPQSALGWLNLAAIHMRQGDEMKAVRPLRRVLKIDPNSVSALNDLAHIYLSGGRREKGEDLLRRALALSPGSVSMHVIAMHVHLGYSLLARGQFDEGWSHTEWRVRAPSCRERQFSAPKWRGQPNPDGTLLVYPEHGFGDNIQFVRYLAMARERWKGRVVYSAYPELFALLDASGLPVEIVSFPQHVPDPRDGYDAFVSIMSLPGLMGTVLNTIPGNVPYLKTPAERMDAWHHLCNPLDPRLNIGLVWSGGAENANDRRRSCNIAQLAPLAGVTGVRYFSLQTGREAAQLAASPDGLEIADVGSGLRDFADTAAVLQHLDLLISVDTAVAHLGGALGRPSWTLLPFVADWRWLIDREDSPWYPTLRLFRQPRSGDWASVWNRVAAELRIMVEARGSSMR